MLISKDALPKPQPFNLNTAFSENLPKVVGSGVKTAKTVTDQKGRINGFEVILDNGESWMVSCVRKPMVYRKQKL